MMIDVILSRKHLYDKMASSYITEEQKDGLAHPKMSRVYPSERRAIEDGCGKLGC
jgi:hypothetical protein